MPEDERLQAIKHLLFNYVRSPSFCHIRDPHAVIVLANEIMRVVDGRNCVWLKWDEHREKLVKSAVGCWIPFDDLRDFLNGMPGPVLITTDVTQRIRAFEDEDYFSYPKEELQPGCLAIHEREKANGTELPAVIGLSRDHVEREEERLRNEQRQQYEQWREKDRTAREQRLLSGADCKWTQLAKSPDWHCRTNGRLYRLSPTKEKMWNLYRANSVDSPNGSLIGKYQRRGDASKAVAQVAYQPDQL
ncbi:hypothetical protein FDV58_29470 [Bradyrhizobium elkanii]|uniref:Uncharacterized protein n=1 Tax=Bradyrhizobium elkanii TaxID=29448 RepID=A0A4U6RSC7_BRAEL|nr:hypothetical protein [Bradyrhizobium elkanii]TKV77734.1 hypothetical protein FDV58_29470 [Bradyrhizobium elkanii]